MWREPPRPAKSEVQMGGAGAPKNTGYSLAHMESGRSGVG